MAEHSASPFFWHGTWDEFNAEVLRRWEGQPVTAHIGHAVPDPQPATPAATPGQAACEAFWGAAECGPERGADAHPAAWNWAQNQRATGAWEAAATAAIRHPAATAERDRLAAELAEARELTAGLAAELDAERATAKRLAARRDLYHGERDEATRERDEARAVAAEMLDWHWQPGGVNDERIAGWRKRLEQP